MSLPSRYKEIIDFFEALQVAGEILEENTIAFKRIKTKKSLQILIKVSLSNEPVQMYHMKSHFFRQDKFNKQLKYYFSFTITLEKDIDEIYVHASLPLLLNDTTLFNNKSQILKMYRNGMAYDLKKQGYKNVEIKDVIGSVGELALLADSKISCEDIGNLYTDICNLNKQSFEVVSKL
ncbi:hypothetical protein D3C87_79780 [compost metagenome]